MGKRRRQKALGSTVEQRGAERKLHPDGAFKNGSSAQLRREKSMRKRLKQFKQRAFPGRLYF
jgi:hypothetical protein